MSNAICIREVRKRYATLQALDGVSLDIEAGEIFGLLGPNGAGKTTLISIIAGLARADSGSVQVMGADVVSDYRNARRMLGVVPQELVFDPFFTVREALEIQSGYFGMRDNRAWIEEILHHLDLSAKADVNMRALSGGMKRRVLVAQALVHKPPVIVLDEPTAGVDVELRQGLWAFVQRLNRDGHTIVLTTHYLEEAEMLCNRIGMLKAGRIVALDSTRNLLENFSGLTLRLRLDRDATGPAAGFPKAEVDGERMVLNLSGFAEIESVLTRLRETGAVIREFDLQPPDLEDVFVRVMAGH
ncbi:MAG: ABC transporter ATP-binding protein [Betaproteobacteria bacterium]|nr:ABC transporter ATP-binding protein [Betaproteobacteria bacterium]